MLLSTKVQCSFINPVSCSNLLPDRVNLVFWTVSLLGFCSSVILLLCWRTGHNERMPSYRQLTSMMHFSSIPFFIFLLAVVSSDTYFGTSYSFHRVLFQQSTFCHLSCFIFMFSCSSSMDLVMLLSVQRYIIVHYPLKVKSMNRLFSEKLISFSIGGTFTNSAVITILISFFNENTIPEMCLSFTNLHKVNVVKEVSVSIISLALMSSLLMVLLHVKTVFQVKKRDEILASNMPKRSHAHLLQNAVTTCVIYTLCWLPASAILLVVLRAENSETVHSLLAWTVGLILPVGFLLLPAFLSGKKHLHKLNIFCCVRTSHKLDDKLAQRLNDHLPV